MFKQFFAADDGTGGGGGEFIQMKDPTTGATVNVPKNLEDFIGKIASYNRRKAIEKKNEEIENLNSRIDELTVENESLRKRGGALNPDIEQLKANHEKIVNELKAKLEAKEKIGTAWRSKFEETKITNDLLQALPTSDLFNVEDTLEKLRRKGNARLVEQLDAMTGEGTGNFRTVLTLSIPDESGAYKQVELSPPEAVKQFLSLDENKFHLKNKLTPGGGSQVGSLSGGGLNIMSEEQWLQLPPKEQAAFVNNGGIIK